MRAPLTELHVQHRFRFFFSFEPSGICMRACIGNLTESAHAFTHHRCLNIDSLIYIRTFRSHFGSSVFCRSDIFLTFLRPPIAQCRLRQLLMDIAQVL